MSGACRGQNHTICRSMLGRPDLRPKLKPFLRLFRKIFENLLKCDSGIVAKINIHDGGRQRTVLFRRFLLFTSSFVHTLSFVFSLALAFWLRSQFVSGSDSPVNLDKRMFSLFFELGPIYQIYRFFGIFSSHVGSKQFRSQIPYTTSGHTSS